MSSIFKIPLSTIFLKFPDEYPSSQLPTPDTHVTPASTSPFITANTLFSCPPENCVFEKYVSGSIPIAFNSIDGIKKPDVELGSAQPKDLPLRSAIDLIPDALVATATE